MMKQKLLWMAMSFVMFFAACNRDEKNLLGVYSYKVSGELVLVDSLGHGSSLFIHRNGQMNVLKDKSQPHGLLITMNEMNGGCYTFPARFQGDSILIEPHQFPLQILSSDGLQSIFSDSVSSFVYYVNAAGSGHSNDRVLIIKEHWDAVRSDNASFTFRASEMTVLAEKN